ncbi:CDP-diacylglycerol--glycerol-3-phosphate 3-phosphatidyltransferase [Thorsellia kenyensis]|uniref:CDP-diacylglycerol--glycerol-3-phosphate 3-phosphatidyltransferase n=1 Tax=Thorsellia kenyensis TaxID=1549888 RepID=A0ABV6CFD8_9GAMM
MPFNIPILLTYFRILLIPVFVIAFYLPFSWTYTFTAGIFLIAAITDWFDGFLARRWNQSTPFGAFLDPVADKVMVAVALVLLTEYYSTWWMSLPIATIIAREIIISSLREWMAELGKRGLVAVSWLGKLKTTAQMTAITCLLWHPNNWIEYAGFISLYIATLLTFWSMFQYLKAAKTDLLRQSEVTTEAQE